jgi:hypothetical protein
MLLANAVGQIQHQKLRVDPGGFQFLRHDQRRVIQGGIVLVRQQYDLLALIASLLQQGLHLGRIVLIQKVPACF